MRLSHAPHPENYFTASLNALMNKYFLSLVVIFIFLLGLFTSPVLVFADSRGYDEAEQIRRAQQRLDEIDKYEKEKARQRYDATHQSSSSDSDVGSMITVIVVCFVLIVAGLYTSIKKEEQEKMDRKNKLIGEMKKEIEREQEIEKEREREKEIEKKLSEAISLGLKIDDSSKICPACAEAIKLKAEICKHCKRSFSKNEVQEAIDSALNIFLNNKQLL